MKESIAYKSGYKYQLAEDYYVSTGIKPETPVKTKYICLTVTGVLHIVSGYAWDGPSGPTLDTANFMRGSLVHDALYQLMREEHISRKHRKAADLLLKQHCLEDGMSRIRAWWVYRAVDLAARKNTLPSKRRKINYAP